MAKRLKAVDRLLKLPSSLEVLGHEYDVDVSDLTDIPELKDPKEAYGISVHGTLKLRVRNDLAPTMVLSTFVHEVAHAVAFQSGLNSFVADKHLEGACDLAAATVMCLVHNGALLLPTVPAGRSA